LDDGHPTRRAQALWALQRLGGLDTKSLLEAARDSAPIVRVHAMRILGERPNDGVEIAQAMTGLTDRNAEARLAATESLARHPAIGNVRHLLDALRRVPAGDAHLRHATRISLRDSLASAGGWEKALGNLNEADRRAVADVALGVPNAE